MKKVIALFACLALSACQSRSVTYAEADEADTGSYTENTDPVSFAETVNQGYTIGADSEPLASRFSPPAGFTRLPQEQGSFATYLRNMPLRPEGTEVYLFDGSRKRWECHAAVLDIDVGTKDLQQCADAVMRLRAEYLWQRKAYDQIAFNFTNGFPASYSRWRQGERIRVSGDRVNWYSANQPSESYEDFRKYLEMVFMYAGTASLSKELNRVADLDQIQPGDVFIKGGFPGHAVIVMDVATHPNGDRAFLLAQSYMPAQDMHVLQNMVNTQISPWYLVSEVKNAGNLETPEWTFGLDALKRW